MKKKGEFIVLLLPCSLCFFFFYLSKLLRPTAALTKLVSSDSSSYVGKLCHLQLLSQLVSQFRTSTSHRCLASFHLLEQVTKLHLTIACYNCLSPLQLLRLVTAAWLSYLQPFRPTVSQPLPLPRPLIAAWTRCIAQELYSLDNPNCLGTLHVFRQLTQSCLGPLQVLRDVTDKSIAAVYSSCNCLGQLFRFVTAAQNTLLRPIFYLLRPSTAAQPVAVALADCSCLALLQLCRHPLRKRLQLHKLFKSAAAAQFSHICFGSCHCLGSSQLPSPKNYLQLLVLIRAAFLVAVS